MGRKLNNIVSGTLFGFGILGLLGGASGCAAATPRAGESQIEAEAREFGKGFEQGVRLMLGLPPIRKDETQNVQKQIIYEYYGNDVYIPSKISNEERKINGKIYILDKGEAWLFNNLNSTKFIRVKYDEKERAIRPPEGYGWVNYNNPDDFRTQQYEEYQYPNINLNNEEVKLLDEFDIDNISRDAEELRFELLRDGLYSEEKPDSEE